MASIRPENISDREPSAAMAAEAPGQAPAEFPAAFIWGAATSSYQIEGATEADGRGESIWDRYASVPGNIADGSSGAIAADHYHRWPEDLDVMDNLGISAYRFSLAWPRILPTGTGQVMQAGLDFYNRLIDALLDRGIEPYPTLYHWDLPQALEDKGGWASRDTANAFGEYASIVADAIGDRVTNWTTLNEPFVSANHGYETGEHAPGIQSQSAGLAAAHHLLVAHGLASDAIRTALPNANVGIVLNFTPVSAANTPAAQAAARRADDIENRWYADPISGFGYPEETVQNLGWDQAEVLDGDMDLIAVPVDFLGVNFYSRNVATAPRDTPYTPVDVTDMGWEVHPQSLEKLLIRFHEQYNFDRYFITENGCAMPDTERRDGRVFDPDRIRYIRLHLQAVHRAIEAGVPLAGYFVWSLIDNFEWGYGYAKKFGIVEIQEGTLNRIPKASADWYRDVVASGTVMPADGS